MAKRVCLIKVLCIAQTNAHTYQGETKAYLYTLMFPQIFSLSCAVKNSTNIDIDMLFGSTKTFSTFFLSTNQKCLMEANAWQKLCKLVKRMFDCDVQTRECSGEYTSICCVNPWNNVNHLPNMKQALRNSGKLSVFFPWRFFLQPK